MIEQLLVELMSEILQWQKLEKLEVANQWLTSEVAQLCQSLEVAD